MTAIRATRKRQQRNPRINIRGERNVRSTAVKAFNSPALIHLRLCKSCNNLFISHSVAAGADIYGNDSLEMPSRAGEACIVITQRAVA